MAAWRLVLWNLPPPTAAGIATQLVGTVPAALALVAALVEGATALVVLFAVLLACLVVRVVVLAARRHQLVEARAASCRRQGRPQLT